MYNQKWVKLVERQSDFWKNFMMISSTGDIKKVFGCTIKERLTTRRGMIFIHWLNPKAVWKCSLQIENKLKKNPKFINKVLLVFTDTKQHLLKVSQKLEKLDYSTITDKGLLKLYDDFCKAYQGLYAALHLAVYIDSIEAKARGWLKKSLLDIKKQDRFDEYFIKLSTFPKLSLLQEEELSLLAIATQVKKQEISKRILEDKIKNHVQKYAGLPVVNDDSEPWDKKYFTDRLSQLVKQSKEELSKKLLYLKSYSTNVKRDLSVLFNRLSAPIQIRQFFELIGLATWIRLVARNTFALSHHSSKDLFGEIGRRCNLTTGDIKWLKPVEVKNLILKNRLPDSKKLAKRKEVAMLLFRDGHYKVFEGKEANDFINKELKEALVLPKTNSLKGSVAFPGIVKGPAKIILSQKDTNKFESGDVLVARMTTPEIIPAVRQAAAIVTDEGGITCHAAIVSRELKKPCVVGTKLATQIFKDGDIIEVEATKGVVKKSA